MQAGADAFIERDPASAGEVVAEFDASLRIQQGLFDREAASISWARKALMTLIPERISIKFGALKMSELIQTMPPLARKST